VAGDLRADPVPDQGDDLAGLGVAAHSGLGEDQLVVKGDLEAPLRRRQQFDGRQDRGPSPEQLVRQTDGARYVVSGNAELDLHPVARFDHHARPTLTRRTAYRRHP
jgi:hypothetical protein